MFIVFENKAVGQLRQRKRNHQAYQSIELDRNLYFPLQICSFNLDPQKRELIENKLSLEHDPKRRTHLTKIVAAYPIAPFIKKVPLSSLRGPPIDETEQTISNHISGQCISTYPNDPNTKLRQGDPICDQYGIIQFENRTLFAVADGCGWGQKAREAARGAVDGFLRHIELRQKELTTTADVGPLLLRAFAEAHNRIIEGKSDQEQRDGMLF